jgi:hypothetical protein
MKAFSESLPHTRSGSGLILLLTEKWSLRRRSQTAAPTTRRAQSNRYPDFGRDLAPAFPTRWSVALGVCSPLQWRNRPRFSRGSQTFDCDGDEPAFISFKERVVVNAVLEICQEKFQFKIFCESATQSNSTSLFRVELTSLVSYSTCPYDVDRKDTCPRRRQTARGSW